MSDGEGADIAPGELRELVRQVLDEHPGVLAAIPGEEGFGLDRALWTKMAELGRLALGIGEAQGGLGLGVAHLAVLYEELGRALAAVPAAGTLIAARFIEAHGSAADQARLLPAIAAGEVLAGVALEGPAPLVLSDGRLHGTADAVGFASNLHIVLVPVASGGDDRAMALVAADAPGLRIEQRPLVDLTRRSGRLVFDGVAVDARALLRPGAAAWDALHDHAAVAVACDSIGGAAAIFERTVDYLGIREQFGRPIGSFQALKHRAASWKVLLEAATALVRHAADAVARGDEGASALASSAKFYAADVYAGLAEDAVQLHGGIGFTWEHPCHLFLKRAKLNQQVFGSSTAHKERVARLAFTDAAPAIAPPPELHVA